MLGLGGIAQLVFRVNVIKDLEISIGLRRFGEQHEINKWTLINKEIPVRFLMSRFHVAMMHFI